MKFKIDWFLAGMAVAVGLAWLWPDPGASGGMLQPEFLNKAGVALVFFLHGVALSFHALKAGTLQWRLHLVVQLCTFLVFPLLGMVCLQILGNSLSSDLRLGIFFLCALPSTVSSSVAMTAAARGNVPAAVFNASLSSLLGILLTPLWVSWMLKAGGTGIPVGKVMMDLLCWLLLPLVIGQCLRPWLATWAHRNKKYINVTDRCVVLFLVYTSFCDSVKSKVWTGHGSAAVLVTSIVCVILFFVVLWGSGMLCRVLKFSEADRIATVFCGTKKTLASGVPMAHLMFAANPGISLILLPIMIYHPLQLVICGMLAGKWAKRPDTLL